MTIEQARVVVHRKPWGVADLAPWSGLNCGSDLIGELSYERADPGAPISELLLKLLFTSAPLSIQVHPDDAYATSISLPNGKSEAWYVLDAAPGAKVALGLTKTLTRDQLRDAIEDRSIAEIVRWQAVDNNDAINVPAGTIHAIGAGLVIAEIQQRSDATFRLFDHGRDRGLHATHGAAAAHLGALEVQAPPKQLSEQRLLLAYNRHFVFERIALEPGSHWHLDATGETWLTAIKGDGKAGPFDLAHGSAVYAEGEPVDIRAGGIGVDCLVAYTGRDGPARMLLQRVPQQSPASDRQFDKARTQQRTIGTNP